MSGGDPVADSWFEEEETRELPRRLWQRRADLGRRQRPARPRTPPQGNRFTVWRLIALTAVAIAVPVTVVSVAAGNDAAAADRSYLGQLAGTARGSARIGRTLSSLLRSGTPTTASLESALTSLARRQQRELTAIAALSPAPTLRHEQQSALDALRLRVAGLNGLLQALQSRSATAAELSAAADRLVTSDVVWRDVFQREAQAQLARDSADHLRAPSSTFLSDPDLAAAESMTSLLSRLQHPVERTNTLLKLGVSGPAVSAWQRQLNRWLVRSKQLQLAVTGIYDPATEQATIRLQQTEHITADGVVGPTTRAALAKALAK